MNTTSSTRSQEAAASASLRLAALVAPAGRQIIQVESTCFPFAEVGDLLELSPCVDFAGDGVYALEYVRPASRWSGLRDIRQVDGGIEIKEPRGWFRVPADQAHTLRLIGRVSKVYASCGEVIEQSMVKVH